MDDVTIGECGIYPVRARATHHCRMCHWADVLIAEKNENRSLSNHNLLDSVTNGNYRQCAWYQLAQQWDPFNTKLRRLKKKFILMIKMSHYQNIFGSTRSIAEVVCCSHVNRNSVLSKFVCLFPLYMQHDSRWNLLSIIQRMKTQHVCTSLAQPMLWASSDMPD
jgi:hypothetical protein